jgi:hypothetical protein
MPATPEQVRDCVLEVLCHMVPGVERNEINDATDPIRGLGLISDDGLDFACEISQRLGFHFPNEGNPFVDDLGRRARRVGEIIELICPMVERAPEATHG